MEKKEAKRGKRRAALRGAVIFGILLLAAAVAVLGALFWQSWQQQKQLKAERDEIAAQLALQREVAAALQAEQADMEAQIQDLLHVEEAKPVITADQLREQMHAVQELVTQQYVYTNAAKREQNLTWIFGWDVPFTGNSLLVTYDGTVKAGIDLGEVKIDVDEDARAITVTLPASKVTDNSIPQESIRVLEVRDGLFNEVSFDDYNTFISEEKKLMEEKAIAMGLLTNADQEAQAIIKAFLSLVPGIETYTLVID